VSAKKPQGRHPIDRLSLRKAHCGMLRRAGFSLVLTLIAAVWGFSGILHVTAPFGRMLFYLAAAFSLLSLLFSLFEAAAEPDPHASASASSAPLNFRTPAHSTPS